MAKPTTDEGVPMSLTEQLKREIQSVAQSIVEEDDYGSTLVALSRLKALKFKELETKPKGLAAVLKAETKDDGVLELLRTHPPSEFLCPISRLPMIDPVFISSSKTFDRPSTQRWLKDGNQTRPQTEQFLSHMNLTPNLLIKEMISRWCKEHAIELPSPQHDVDEETVIAKSDIGSLLSLLQNLNSSTLSDQGCLSSLIERIPSSTVSDQRSLSSELEKLILTSLLQKLRSSTLFDQKMAAKEIRQRTALSSSFRTHFGEIPEALSSLVEPFSSGMADMDPELQENLVAAIYNLSLRDINKMLLAKIPAVICLVIQSLNVESTETRRNAVAALDLLSYNESNKYTLGKSGALKPLIEILEGGHPQAMRDAANAIFRLWTVHENKQRTVSNGVVAVICKKLRVSFLRDEMLAMLALLASNQKAIEEMAKLVSVSLLLRIIREDTSEDNKENSIVILYEMCFNDPEKLKEIKGEEDKLGTISTLARGGTSIAKRKAIALLKLGGYTCFIPYIDDSYFSL